MLVAAICTLFVTSFGDISPSIMAMYNQSPPFEKSEDATCIPPSNSEERKLFSQLTPESQQLYTSLDCMGKKRALKLSQKYRDKNKAVQQAAKEMAKRQKALPEHPQEQVEQFSGQDRMGGRFGY